MNAIKIVLEERKYCLYFIEVIVHRDDTSKELLEFGSKFGVVSSRLSRVLLRNRKMKLNFGSCVETNVRI